MKVVLVSPPVSTPTVMPYSLAMMKGVLRAKLAEEIVALDLNAQFHYNEFSSHYQRLGEGDYFELLDAFVKEARGFYPSISKDLIAGKKPLGFEKILRSILDEKPDIVAMSLTYNSQIFYAKALIDSLNEFGIKVVLGGPADYSKIMKGTLILPSFESLIEYLVSLGAVRKEGEALIDFSDFRKEFYFTQELVYPMRTSSSCPYKRCTFCTHHGNRKYELMDLSLLSKAIIENGMKKICFIDDDIPPSRLREIAALLKPLGVSWWCQLRALRGTSDLLPELYEAGLRSVAWGVESGCQRVLDYMQKGTKVDDVAAVLAAAHNVGIKNMVYVLFGLPSETEEEFMQTVTFLEKNAKNIDLISASVFGLQQGARIFAEPEKFGVSKVILEKRTYLGDKVTYEAGEGLSQDEAKILKKKVRGRLDSVNSLPKVIAHCKEQVLNFK